MGKMVFGKNGKVLGSSELSSMSATRPPDSHSYAKSRCWSRPGAVHWKGKYLNPAIQSTFDKYSYFSLLFKHGSQWVWVPELPVIFMLWRLVSKDNVNRVRSKNPTQPHSRGADRPNWFPAAAISNEDEIWYGAVSDKSTCLKTLEFEIFGTFQCL